jgi:hypothetical protein
MNLPPYIHEKFFSTERWHPYKKVMNDLKSFGKVKLYEKFPNQNEIDENYKKLYFYHNKYLKKIN